MTILQQLSNEMSPDPSTTSDIGLDYQEEDPSVEGGITNHHKGRAYPAIPMFTASDNGCGDSEKPSRPKWREPRSNSHDPHTSGHHARDNAADQQTRQQ
jgi:hypothetical protein